MGYFELGGSLTSQRIGNHFMNFCIDPFLPRRSTKRKQLVGMRAIATFLASCLFISSAGFGAGVDYAKRYVAVNMRDEPKTMDPQKADDEIALTLLAHVNEGLVRLDPKNNPIPGVAESWELKDKTTYIFKLRKNALWSDGKPVRAQDFVFGWRRAIDPKTASQYSFMLFPVKNGEAINKGKMPLDKLGVSAVDDQTLKVELENPTGYFLRLASFGTFYPAREDFVTKHGEKYAADAKTLLSNGPWQVDSWKHNASIRLVKNEKYWNKDKIWLNTIDFPYLMRDLNSEFNMFKDDKFALVWRISKEQLPEAQRSKMKIRRYHRGTVWFLQFNTKRPPMSNVKFRKAIQIGLDRSEFVRMVNGLPGAQPAYGIIPSYMPGVNKTYGEEYSVAFKDAQVTEAKKLLEEVKKELGLKAFKPIGVLASDTDTTRRDMEYFQRYFKEHLGLELKLDFQTFKVRLERSEKGDFDMANTGWGPDYLDPMTFADLYASWNANNNSQWSSKQYDNYIKTAMASVDQKERLDAMHAANKILLEEVPVVPYIEDSAVYVQDPALVGVVRRTVAPDIDFYYARIKDPAKVKK